VRLSVALHDPLWYNNLELPTKYLKGYSKGHQGLLRQPRVANQGFRRIKWGYLSEN